MLGRIVMVVELLFLVIDKGYDWVLEKCWLMCLIM